MYCPLSYLFTHWTCLKVCCYLSWIPPLSLFFLPPPLSFCPPSLYLFYSSIPPPILPSSILLPSLILPSLLPPSLPLHTTADNPDLVPVQPTQTPPIFFDPQSSTPWEFSLNLSVVTPTSQMRPNFTRPVIHGFILQIIVEQNGVNITDNHYMVGLRHTADSCFCFVYKEYLNLLCMEDMPCMYVCVSGVLYPSSRCVCVCVRVWVRACVRACVHACTRVTNISCDRVVLPHAELVWWGRPWLCLPVVLLIYIYVCACLYLVFICVTHTWNYMHLTHTHIMADSQFHIYVCPANPI